MPPVAPPLWVSSGSASTRSNRATNRLRRAVGWRPTPSRWPRSCVTLAEITVDVRPASARAPVMRQDAAVATGTSKRVASETSAAKVGASMLTYTRSAIGPERTACRRLRDAIAWSLLTTVRLVVRR